MNEPCVALVLSLDPTDRGALCRILEFRGYLTAGVMPGAHALAYVTSARPDIVIYDIHQDLWPDAINLIRTMHDAAPDARIVAIREQATWRMFWDVLDAGGADLLPKPYTSNRLLNALELALGKVSA